MTTPFMGKTFQTAARRRGGELLTFAVQHWGPDAVGTPGPINVVLRVDPMVDAVRIGAAFGTFATMLGNFGDTAISSDEKVAALDRELPKARAALRECIVPPDRAAYDAVAEGLSVSMLGDLVQWITQETSGLDPTKQASSSIGSPPTGSPSTDGVPPVA